MASTAPENVNPPLTPRVPCAPQAHRDVPRIALGYCLCSAVSASSASLPLSEKEFFLVLSGPGQGHPVVEPSLLPQL